MESAPGASRNAALRRTNGWAQPLSGQEKRAVVCVCILAAFADGAQDETERSHIERIVNVFSEDHLDLTSAYQEVLAGKLPLPRN